MRKPAVSDFLGHRLTIPRLVGAASLLAVGGVHLQQYVGADYRVIPTIGTLFLLNFIGATVLGLYLLVPARARVGRARFVTDTIASLSGIGLALSGFAALIVSEHTPLFGFMEFGYRFAIVFTIASEGVATVMLATFLILSFGARRQTGHRRPRAGGPAATPVTQS